jgi:elongation factor P
MIDATQIRKGMIINMDGTLYRVMEMQLITPGRWKAMVQTKLRNIQNGSQTEHRFRSEERLEQAHFDEVEMEFLYEQGGEYVFMNLENYEQVACRGSHRRCRKYLKPNTVTRSRCSTAPAGVNLPTPWTPR